jgi:hypothetical protein
VQNISFEAEPLLHTFKFGPHAIDLVILEDDVSDDTEHVRRRAFKNCEFASLAIYLQEIDVFDAVVT